MKSAVCAFIVGVFSQAALHAAPTAKAVAPSLVAVNVPIVLDGSGSTDPDGKPLTYFWRQMSGGPLEIVGQDRAKAMIISAKSLGNAVIRLEVSNGTDTAVDDRTITVVTGQSRVIYVDNSLSGNCLSGNYSIAKRDCSGSDGIAYSTLQAAADVVKPGDTVFIRGGTFKNVLRAGSPLSIVHVTTSGKIDAPIRFSAYNGERVVLEGFGFEDRDLDKDPKGLADGPTFPSKRENLFWIEADYIQVIGIEMHNSEGSAVVLSSSYCYFEECLVYDNWTPGFLITNPGVPAIEGNVFRRVESHNNRHGSGMLFQLNTLPLGFIRLCTIMESLFYLNGYEPNGSKVLPILGDPQGGGNSDGLTLTKEFSDSAASAVPPVDNLGPNFFIIRNIAYHNCDDGFDTSCADSLVEDNFSLQNGPTGNKGLKMLRPVRNMSFRGNLAHNNNSVGLELRLLAGSRLVVAHNTSTYNHAQGFLGADSVETQNNVAAFNLLNDMPITPRANSSNWSKDGTGAVVGFRGDPLLVAPNGFTLNVNFPTGMTVAERRSQAEKQIRIAFTPRETSPLIDKGQIIPGYHCPRADDDPVDPMPLNAPGRHWLGKAPDIGAFEFGFLPPPTKPSAPKNLRVVP